ncbi:MAG: lectin-like protein [Candidatus Poribacteria bacterium]|nr:lectin-like protein [Candidatus Poribacteria bacterium]
MTRISFLGLLLFITSMSILTGQLTTYDSVAQDDLSTFSGRVINSDGEPIVGVTVTLPTSSMKTDSEGRFILTDIPSGQVKLSLPGQNVGIQSIRIGNVSFFYTGFGQDGAVPFTITPGKNINNAEIITENPLRIRSRIVFKNGEPLANDFLDIDVDCITLDFPGNNSFSRSIQTDGQGNFEVVIYQNGVYSLSINHRGLSAEVDPFLVLSEGEVVSQVLRLNGNPKDFSEPPPVPEQNERNRRQNVSDIPGMWIINPLNGHAYKRIICKDRTDAQIQAEKENAYLVTITNLHEQVWLETAFGADNYWIGITDIAEEGKWLWENGEPVIYTNWEEFEAEDNLELNQPPAFLRFFGMKDEKERHKDIMHDYAIMTFSGSKQMIGKWKKINPDSPHSHGPHFIGRVRMAIIEKEVK